MLCLRQGIIGESLLVLLLFFIASFHIVALTDRHRDKTYKLMDQVIIPNLSAACML